MSPKAGRLPRKPLENPLSPRLADFVRFYSDPLLSTYGNAALSARVAGIRRQGSTVLKNAAVQAKLEQIRSERDKSQTHAMQVLGDASVRAAKHLVARVDAAHAFELRSIPPEADTDQQKHDLDYNRFVLKVIEGIRHDEQLILQYKLGHPMQRHEVTTPPTALAELSDDELKLLVAVTKQSFEARRLQRARAATTIQSKGNGGVGDVHESTTTTYLPLPATEALKPAPHHQPSPSMPKPTQTYPNLPAPSVPAGEESRQELDGT